MFIISIWQFWQIAAVSSTHPNASILRGTWRSAKIFCQNLGSACSTGRISNSQDFDHDWWLSPTPLKNDGVKVNWDDDIPNTSIWKISVSWAYHSQLNVSHNPFMFQSTNQMKLQKMIQFHGNPRRVIPISIHFPIPPAWFRLRGKTQQVWWRSNKDTWILLRAIFPCSSVSHGKRIISNTVYI